MLIIWSGLGSKPTKHPNAQIVTSSIIYFPNCRVDSPRKEMYLMFKFHILKSYTEDNQGF